MSISYNLFMNWQTNLKTVSNISINLYYQSLSITNIEIHNKELMVRLFYELIKLKSEHYLGKFVEIFKYKLEDVFVVLK